MSRGLNTPYFPNPPAQYDQRYMMQLVQAFAVFAQQIQNPGPWQSTDLTLTAIQDNEYGLAPGAVYHQGGVLRIVLENAPSPMGASATSAVGSVSVSIT